MSETGKKTAAAAPAAGSRVLAVVELGTTSVRMVVAQAGESGELKTLDHLQQAVAIGKDTFTGESITHETTEECVKALRNFSRVLDEFGLTDPRRIMAVATSAVREAANRDWFLDRIYIATGIDVEAIDEADVNRFVYLAVAPFIAVEPSLRTGDSLVVEVGGGSTEILMFHEGKVGVSLTHRLGSLRLRKTYEDYRAPMVRLSELMQGHIDVSMGQVVSAIGRVRRPSMLALGGDIRFAAAALCPRWDRKGIAKLDVHDLEQFTDKLVNLPVDDLVRRHGLSFPDAETLAPALLVYVRLARALGMREILVCGASLRDGILSEMATHGSWTAEFRKQVISAAMEVGKRYAFDRRHGEQVARLSRQFFEALREEHRLGPRYELILTIASLLHDVGMFISNRSHHKHSMYLVLNSDIFGLGARDLLITALVVRYHRKVLPQPTHEEYASLDRDGRIAVAKMAAILRIAEALDRGHAQRARKLDIRMEPGKMILTARLTGDLTLEQHALQDKREMFEQVYGMRIILRTE